MIKTKKRIVHLADYQIEVRNSGEGNRYDEFRNGLEDVLLRVMSDKPEMIVITGDLYEFANTTSSERKIQTWFFRELSKIAIVVVSNGNHDLKQRNNELIMKHKSVVEPDDIESVLDAMDSDRIHYLKRTGFYEIEGITFAVWGHYEKFNKVPTDQRPYSPWELDEAKDYDPKTVIELFHDPVQNCKGFNNRAMEHFSNYKIQVTDFKSPLILAGDIHMPDVINFKNPLLDYAQVFTYCSSTIMRNFGEGNYYRNGNLYQNGNDKHGYNLVEYMVMEDGTVDVSIKFKAIKPSVSRHTMILDADFDYSNLSMLRPDASEFNMIRFKIEDNVNDFFKHQETIYSYINEFCTCVIDEPIFDKGVGVEFEDGHTIDDVESIINNDKILELADVYIGRAIDKSTTISKDDADEAKMMLLDMFKLEFAKNDDLTKNIKQIGVRRLMISNCLTFGDDVEVIFDEVGNIVRVTGANAVGKTKIFTVLGYMFTDLLHADQKPSQHKNNRLDLFNYTRPNDVVSVEMDFEVNGKAHKLTKVVEKSWKRGKNMWQDKEWRTFISGTPSLDIVLTTPDSEVTDYDEVMAFMRDLISFDDFYRHLFVNQRSLENLLKMNTDVLIGEILKIIGLNFFDSLNETYDEVKDKKMDSLTKPSGTIESLLSEIGKSKDLKITIGERKSELTLDFLSIANNRQDVQGEIDVLKASIGSIRKASDVELDLTLKQGELDSHTTKKSNYETLVENDGKIVDGIIISEIETAIEGHRKTQREIVETKANTQTLLTNVQKDADNKQKEIDTFIESAKNKQTTKINALNVEVNDIKSKNTTQNERLVEIKGEIASNLKIKTDANTLKIDTQHKVYDDFKKVYDDALVVQLRTTNLLSSLETNLSNKKSTLESYSASDKCSKCGEFVADGIDKKIDLIKQEISNINVDIDVNKESKLREDSEVDNSKIEMDESKVVLDDLKKVVISHTIVDEPTLKTEVQGIAKILGDNKELISTKESEIEVIKLDDSYLQDELVVKLKAEVASVGTRQMELANTVHKCDTDHKIEADSIVALESKTKLRGEVELRLVTNRGHVKGCEKDIEITNKELGLLNTELIQSKGVETVYSDIELKKQRILSLDNSKLVLQREDLQLDHDLILSDKVIEDNELAIRQLREYTLTTSVLKQYKTMLGKSGLQKYIFSKIVEILNGRLSVLLEDVSMRLFFDKDNLDLRKYDLRSNILSGVQMASGMESSILGLSLLKALKTLNQIRKFNVLMVDEISGQFNNGKGLTYKAYDYQSLFVTLLSKIKDDTCVYVVDHVIEDLGETSTLEVELTDNGSIIKQTNN